MRRQQTIPRPMTAKTTGAVTPKLLPAATSAVYTADDVNDYTRPGGAGGGGGGGGCVVHRALPSLPRGRMDGSWAKSVRSDASGSDASLHWDTPDDAAAEMDELAAAAGQPRAVRCRSVAAGADDDARCAQQVREVRPGCRTMPRPGGVDIDRQRLLVAQQLQQQLRPFDRAADDRPYHPYANVADHSVDV